VRFIRRILMVCALAVSILSAPGCGGKFNRTNYDTIYLSQPADDVRLVLGEPTEMTDNRWIYIHRRPFYQAAITFDSQMEVSQKRWSYQQDTLR